MKLVVAIAEFIGAGLLITKAITGASWAQIITGQAEAVYANAHGGTASTTLTAATAAAGGPVPKVEGKVTESELEKIATEYGWNSAQISDWMRIIGLESGGNPNATNPSSGAYGIAQMLGGTTHASDVAKYARYGGNASTVIGQLEGMAGYIQQSYGSPAEALSFHLANGYY